MFRVHLSPQAIHSGRIKGTLTHLLLGVAQTRATDSHRPEEGFTMADGGNAAMSYGARLDEIKFPEFTTKLVTDTFDALIAADLRQQQAFIELVQALGKSLKDYINDTKDDIGPQEIAQLFTAAVPLIGSTGPNGESNKVFSGGTLSAAEAKSLNDALAVEPAAAVTDDNKVAKAGALDATGVTKLLDAAAIRIAANKYTLLKEMVKLGLLRLVVDKGVIETKLNFHSYGSDYFRTNSSLTRRAAFDARASASSGKLVSLWVNASASTSFNTVTVSTSTTSAGSNSGVDIQIMGGVRIEFHTDYLPLAQN